MRFLPIRSALPFIAIMTAFSLIAVLATRYARRENRLMMAAYYQQKEAEALVAAREERYVADLAEGTAQSPILPFLKPIGKAEPHRVAAAAHDRRAFEYGRISREFDHAAARPWRSIDVTLTSP
jgi:hypothetical protein